MVGPITTHLRISHHIAQPFKLSFLTQPLVLSVIFKQILLVKCAIMYTYLCINRFQGVFEIYV